MTKKFSRILLTAVFALLQCVAPLVHAHIDGQHSGILPPSPVAQYHDHSNSAQASSSTYFEEQDSPAICLAHEFQRDHQCNVAPPTPTGALNIPECSTVKPLAVAAPIPFALPPYHKPNPQAPPVSS